MAKLDSTINESKNLRQIYIDNILELVFDTIKPYFKEAIINKFTDGDTYNVCVPKKWLISVSVSVYRSAAIYIQNFDFGWNRYKIIELNNPDCFSELIKVLTNDN